MTDIDDGFAFGDGADLAFTGPGSYVPVSERGGFNAMAAGTAYALWKHGLDDQTDALLRAFAASRQQGTAPPAGAGGAVDPERALKPALADVTQFRSSTPDTEGFDGYIGQEAIKRQMRVHMDAAKMRGEALPHTLLASGYPGVGKTTLARKIADYMGVRIIELVPPFNAYVLAEAMDELRDGDILFLDEIHKLADSGKRGAEILLKPMEERVMFLPDGTTQLLQDITIIGATTDRDKLPEPVIDRFKIKPFFSPYTIHQLIEIAFNFAGRHRAVDAVTEETGIAMAYACRQTPRVLEEMVYAARDMYQSLGDPPTPGELLDFMEIERDGLTRVHVQYLTSLRQFFGRTNKEGEVEYLVGEIAMLNILRETKQGLGRIERFLTERGFLDRTPRGRRLTPEGIERAEQLIAQGKGASSAA